MDRIDPTWMLIACVTTMAVIRLLQSIRWTPEPKTAPAVDTHYEEVMLDRRLKDFLGMLKFGDRLPPEKYRAGLDAVRALRFVAKRELHARGPEAMLAMVDYELEEIRRTLET